MEKMLRDLAVDLRKSADKGNRAAAQRVRTGTVQFAKLAKLYRKESIAAEKEQASKQKGRMGPPRLAKATSKSRRSQSVKSARKKLH